MSVMFKRMMILRYPDWIEQLIFRSKVQECYAGFGGIAKFVDECFFQVCRGVRILRALMINLISPQERCFSQLEVEIIHQVVEFSQCCVQVPSGLCDFSSEKVQFQYEFG